MSNFILTYRNSKGIIKHKFFSNIGTQMLDSQGVIKPKYFPVPITGEQMLDYALKYLHPKDDKVLCVETWVTRDIYDTDPNIKETMCKEYIAQFEKSTNKTQTQKTTHTMKETYSFKDVKQVVKDIVTIAFDPNPNPDFYVELFSKYDEELQEYITNALLAALMARKFAELTMESK